MKNFRDRLTKSLWFLFFGIFVFLVLYQLWPTANSEVVEQVAQSNKKSKKDTSDTAALDAVTPDNPRTRVDYEDVGHQPPKEITGEAWRFVTVPVGQGNANLLVGPEKQVAVIDAGPPNGKIDYLIRLLRYWNIDTIKTFLITHPHGDHIGGASRLLDEFKVHKVIAPKTDHPTAAHQELLEQIKDRNISYRQAKRGDEIELIPDLRARVLNPGPGPEDNLNNSSIVLEISLNDVEIVATGDAEKTVERELIQNDLLAPVEALKVAHHGSRSSTSEKFLAELKPELGIISVPRPEESPYGHPHEQVVERLAKNGIKRLETGEHGFISLRVPTGNPDKYFVSHYYLRDLQKTPEFAVNRTLFSTAASEWQHQIELRARENNRWELDENRINLHVAYESYLYYGSNLAPKLLYRGRLPEAGLASTQIQFNSQPGRETGLFFWRDQKNWISWALTGDSRTRLVYRRGEDIHQAFTLGKAYPQLGLYWRQGKLTPLVKTGGSWKRFTGLELNFKPDKYRAGLYARSWRGEGDYRVQFTDFNLKELQ